MTLPAWAQTWCCGAGHPARASIACTSPAKCYRAMCSIPPLSLDLISDDRGVAHRLGCRGALRGRQLDHGGVLSRPQPREQHDPPIGEFQRIVVRMGILQVDLPEPGHISPELAQARQHPAEGMIEFSLLLEHYLRTRKQADRDRRLSDRRKAARGRAGEACGHQSVADPGRAGSGIVQTVVTHLDSPHFRDRWGPRESLNARTSTLVRGVRDSGGNERDSNPHLPLARRGLSQLSYRPGRERAAAQAATPRKWRLKLVTIQPVRVFGRAIIRS